MKTWKITFSVLALGALLSACSVKGNIEDLTNVTTNRNPGQVQGLISGSQNVTASGYKVSATVGDYSGGIVQKVNGYTVYGSVEGAVASQ